MMIKGDEGVGFGSAKGQHEREREKIDGQWRRVTRTREGMTCLTTMRKKERKEKKKNNVVLQCTGTSRMRAGGYGNNEKKQRHKRE